MNIKQILLLSAPIAMLWGCTENKASEKKTEVSIPHYALAKVSQTSMEQTVKLPAQLSAYQEVSIFPKVNGYVKNVAVDIGTKVNKNQLLMEVDAPEIQQALLQAKEKYARAKADYNLDKENYFRLKTASRTAGAISPMDLATAKSKMEADSALCNAEKASWQMQQAMNSYLHVTAPFSGIITERNTHPGALVSAEAKDEPMLELKEVDHLRLQVDVPEALASALKSRDSVTFYLSAMPGKKMAATVSRKAGSVNIQYRTERVELDVPNKKAELSPGMYAEVNFKAKGNSNALTVPKSAVVTSTERKFVIAVRDGKTIRVDVATGIENKNNIQVVGNLNKGEKVIASATDEIEEGIAVK